MHEELYSAGHEQTCIASNVWILNRLPQQHRRNNLGLQIVSWTESGCCCEIYCGEFGGIETHPFAGVENFAFAGVVDENLKMVRAFLDYEPQTLPLALVTLPAAHHSSVSLALGLVRNWRFSVRCY